MYVFRTTGGDVVALRPEGTAPIARSYIQNGMVNLPQPLKIWYWGPFFRYEHPQSGRYRQFWQFGFEILGEKGAVIDAQLIQIFHNILKELKLKNLMVEVNSIGDSQCRPYYKKLLSSYFKSREGSLCTDCKRRVKENVLRVMDCKEDKCQPLKADAPEILDHLCEECKAHFKEVLEFLDELEISYSLNHHLVRGLDYYTKTVFEITARSEEKGSNLSIAGGGRYDRLVRMLGGKDVPACGGAAGIERIVQAMKAQNIIPIDQLNFPIFLSQLGQLAKKKSLKLLENFRSHGIPVGESFGRDSLKAQMSRASRVGAQYTLILGQKEALEETVIVRDMQSGKQDLVKFDAVVDFVKKKLRKK